MSITRQVDRPRQHTLSFYFNSIDRIRRLCEHLSGLLDIGRPLTKVPVKVSAPSTVRARGGIRHPQVGRTGQIAVMSG